LGALLARGQASWATGEYEYNGSGNIKTTGSESYLYDEIGRVKSRTEGQQVQSHTYDAFGNVLTVTTTGDEVLTPCVDSATNRMARASTQAAPCNVVATYSNGGYIRSYNASSTFSYDAHDMVVESNVNGTRRVYLYAANDERIASIVLVNNARTQSEWTLRDDNSEVLTRYSEAGGDWSWSEDYIYRNGQLLAAEVPGTDRASTQITLEARA
jgi:YD repeat-containing protein